MKLSTFTLEILRFQILEHSLEALVSRHEGTAIVKDVRADIDELLSRLYGDPTTAATTAGGSGKGRARVCGADRKGARQEVRSTPPAGGRAIKK